MWNSPHYDAMHEDPKAQVFIRNALRLSFWTIFLFGFKISKLQTDIIFVYFDCRDLDWNCSSVLNCCPYGVTWAGNYQKLSLALPVATSQYRWSRHASSISHIIIFKTTPCLKCHLRRVENTPIVLYRKMPSDCFCESVAVPNAALGCYAQREERGKQMLK